MTSTMDSVRRLFSIGAILAAAVTSPERIEAAEGTDTCHVCGPNTICPIESQLPTYDTACQTRCGYGTYAGACTTDQCDLGSGVSIICYYIQ
jgi:hypothetical protein